MEIINNSISYSELKKYIDDGSYKLSNIGDIDTAKICYNLYFILSSIIKGKKIRERILVNNIISPITTEYFISLKFFITNPFFKLSGLPKHYEQYNGICYNDLSAKEKHQLLNDTIFKILRS